MVPLRLSGSSARCSHDWPSFSVIQRSTLPTPEGPTLSSVYSKVTSGWLTYFSGGSGRRGSTTGAVCATGVIACDVATTLPGSAVLAPGAFHEVEAGGAGFDGNVFGNSAGGGGSFGDAPGAGNGGAVSNVAGFCGSGGAGAPGNTGAVCGLAYAVVVTVPATSAVAYA